MLLALVTGIVLASAIAVLLSSVNVYLRDTQHLIEVILTAWFWACPIVYLYQEQIAKRLGPKGLTWVYFLNPMVPLILSFQRCIYAHPTTTRWSTGSTRPSTCCPRKAWGGTSASISPCCSWRLVLFLVALAVFGRLEGNFAEEL